MVDRAIWRTLDVTVGSGHVHVWVQQTGTPQVAPRACPLSGTAWPALSDSVQLMLETYAALAERRGLEGMRRDILYIHKRIKMEYPGFDPGTSRKFDNSWPAREKRRGEKASCAALRSGEKACLPGWVGMVIVHVAIPIRAARDGASKQRRGRGACVPSDARACPHDHQMSIPERSNPINSGGPRSSRRPSGRACSQGRGTTRDTRRLPFVLLRPLPPPRLVSRASVRGL